MKRITLFAVIIHSLIATDIAAQPAVGSDPKKPLPVEIIKSHELQEGSGASQGVAIGKSHYFGSDNKGDIGLIRRFDTNWKLLETIEYNLPGVNHIGALSLRDGFLWTGFLNAKGPRKSVVAKLSAQDLSVVSTFDITDVVTWIDPVCFDGSHVWVGDMSDMGIHRFRIENDRLIRDGILRYPRELHFSQGIQIRGNRLYSMHTFGDWDGLAEFDITGIEGEHERAPLRVWAVPESRMHLEGFDFVPGKPGEIWHAQGKVVDHIRLTNY